MRHLRNLLMGACLALGVAAVPALAAEITELNGVLERVDASAGTVQLQGVTVHVPAPVARLADFRAGDAVLLEYRVENGQRRAILLHLDEPG